jgi:hypothetical protein
MYNIVKVGIPIQTSNITSEFLDIINIIKTENCIGITTVDYYDNINDNFMYHKDTNSSLAGHRIIFDNLKFNKYENKFILNRINTLGSIWEITGSKDKSELTKNLLDIIDKQYDQLKFDTVYIFSTGSPYFMDIFTEGLQLYRDIQIVDTKSSFDIAVESIHNLLNCKLEPVIRKYNGEFILNNNPYINLDKLNIFSSINNLYKWKIDIPLVDHFFNTLNNIVDKNAIFFMVSILENEVVIKKMKYYDAELVYKNESENTIPFIIGICKETYDII